MKTIGFIGLGLIGGSIAKRSAEFIRITIFWPMPDGETLAAALNSGLLTVYGGKRRRYHHCDYISSVPR